MDILHNIINAKALPGYKVHVVFDTGESGIFDCSSYLDHPYWKRLSDPAFFRLVRVEYGTLVWPDDIDIAPEDIWERCVRDPVPFLNGADSHITDPCVAEAPAEYDAGAKPTASSSRDNPASP